MPGGFGFFAAGKILLPGALAAAARGCRWVRCVGYTAPFAAGAASLPRAETESLYPRPKRCQLRASRGSLRGLKKMSRVRAAGGACQVCGDGCGAGGACGCRTWHIDGARRCGFDGVATPPARRRPGPIYTLQTYARRRRAPPRPVKNKDRRPPLLPRLLHKGHAAVEAVAAQVVAVHTY